MQTVSTELQPVSFLQLPQDVLFSICQKLLEARDLLCLEQCSQGCRMLVNRANIWNCLLQSRFGEEAYSDQAHTQSSLLVLKRRCVFLSRLLIPAADLEGVLPGNYQVLWRVMKTSQGNVGDPQSEMQCSADVHPVHPTSHPPETATANMTYVMQHFNDIPFRQWVVIPGGHVTINTFSQVHVRMWCLSNEWKRGLLWDYVKLHNLDQPVVSEGAVVVDRANRTAHQPDAVQNVLRRASDAVEAAVDSVQAACRLQ